MGHFRYVLSGGFRHYALVIVVANGDFNLIFDGRWVILFILDVVKGIKFQFSKANIAYHIDQSLATKIRFILLLIQLF